MRSSTTARGVLAGLVGLSAFAVAGTIAATTAGAVAADCAVPADIATLTRGQELTGLTVAPSLDDPSADGVTPTAFDGTVIGVAQDAIAPGYDLVMVEIHSDEIDRVGGIWAGMSGSPMYTAAGDLVGATAWTLTSGTSHVVGVTPYSQMDDYLPTSSPRATVRSPALARRIADAAGVSEAKAASGFTPIFDGSQVSGVTPAAMRRFKKAGLPYVQGQKVAHAGMVGGRGQARADVADIVPGGNLGAFYSYGDIPFGGIGTVTDVCAGQVVGFGHTMDLFGDTNGYLMAADALYIQDSGFDSPFKVANLGDVVGTLNQDHLRMIGGTLGELPSEGVVSNSSTYTTSGGHLRSRSGETHVATPVVVADIFASTVLYQMYYNMVEVADYEGGGSVDLEWTIEGTDAGIPFTLSSSDLFTSDYYSFEEPAYEPADLTYALGSIPGVDITGVDSTTELSTGTTTYRVKQVQWKKGSAWVTATRKHPIVAKPGSVALRVGLTASDGSTAKVAMSLSVPKTAAGRSGSVHLSGGGSIWTNFYRVDSVAEARRVVDSIVPNAAVQAQGVLYADGSRAAKPVKVSAISRTGDHVINGGATISIVVK
ncbi:MAG: hypothetical protein ACSLEW_13905 [Nocardioides sp.]